MLRTVDRVSDFCARLAAVMFFAVGGMIAYEVVARYAFGAPTIWSEELSRFFQIWATYLAAAYVFRDRHLIVITAVVDRLGRRLRIAAEVFSLLIIGAFSLVAVWYGAAIVVESVVVGRSTSTMLSVPKWMTESAIPIGFGLLLIQVIVNLLRLALGAGPSRREGRDTLP